MGFFLMLIMAFNTLFFSILILLVAVFFPSRRHWQDHIVHRWAKCCFFISHAKIVIHGRENTPKKGALFLFNHSSFLDIPTLNMVFPRLRFGAKEELFRVPVFGAALRKIGTLLIVRKNSQKTLQVYKESIARVHKGGTFALAPEGTRKDGTHISSFKRGPFIFAIEGQFPLVPVILVGTNQVLSNKSWSLRVGVKRKKIQVYILPPVETKKLSLKDVEALKQKVHSLMSDRYWQLTSSASSPSKVVG